MLDSVMTYSLVFLYLACSWLLLHIDLFLWCCNAADLI